jgi:hypothetical protein
VRCQPTRVGGGRLFLSCIPVQKRTAG